MRIDGNQAAQSLPESGRSANPSPATGDARSSVSSPLGESSLGEDQAQFSGATGQVQALAEQVLQFPEIREEKVNALRQVVQDGNYQPSSKQVADAMFAHMLVTPAA
jgi:flagellar biosynthesis anti-sigma factor FlgM